MHNVLCKSVPDCSSRHSDRAFYQDDIFLLCIYIGFFVRLCGVAFFRHNEFTGRLDGVCPQGKCLAGQFPAADSPSQDYRYFLLKLFFILTDLFYHSSDFSFIAVSVKSLQLFFGKSQMPSCLWPFYYNKVRYTAVFFCPILKNHPGRFLR